MLKTIAVPALFLMISFVSPIKAEDNRYQKYLNFMKKHQFSSENPGSYKRGEIEIVLDLKEIKEIEEARKAILLNRGYTKEHAIESSRIGVITEDEYWIWVRDGVIFPTGAKGTYNRIVWKREMTDDVPRVAMLPVLPNGKIVLNLNFRHALRKWVLEIPRGFKLRDEPNEIAVKRQLKEETGYESKNMHLLGNLAPDSSALSTYVPIFLVNLGKKNPPNQDYTEAILRIEEFTIDEIKKIIADGSVVLDINGKKERVEVSDSYLAYSILQAETKKMINSIK